MAASLAVLLVAFARKFAALVAGALTADIETTIIGVLSLVDLSLLANLVLIVLFAGYESFVSRLDMDGAQDMPAWIGHVDFAAMKTKLIASIVAIAAISVLEDFLHVTDTPDRELAWHAGVLGVFVAVGLALAVMDRIGGQPGAH